MILYQIQATIHGKQIPTFYLDSDVQGIVNGNQAIGIAQDIIGDSKKLGFYTVEIITIEIEPGHIPQVR